uniref:Protein translocase subunit SecA n=1 Tax=Wrangelia sp. TaxID=2575620 RepID=A0A4D6X5H6_9FLOR|nr:Preprotein-translocase subunit a [Wrangelia sp.]
MINFLLNNPINKYQNMLININKLYTDINIYSDEELKQQTYKLKNKIKNHNINLDELLIESFATAKVAIQRATGMTLYNVQILGAIILYYGNIAEMKTGEGKTISAILPAYLHALTEKGVHIITVNDYLVNRDSNLAKKIFSYLDISIGKIISKTDYINRSIEYKKDITYITNSELGFDYLRDNMALEEKELVQRNKFYYAVIDEVDSILIDEARTPLIISGKSEINTNQYYKSKEITQFLNKDYHYEVDEKSRNIILTEIGITLCEKILNLENLYNINSNNFWIKYIINSLKAKELFLINKDYIIKNKEIIIVDEFTGRLMYGRRWSDGLHQAIEAKENLPIQPENKTLASITYQNLFLLYEKLSGMTGTAKTEETEFYKTYKLSVIEIPTNKTCCRKDLADLVYKLEYNKWEAIANECFDMYQIGRPTLIGTTSIEKSELLASMLQKLNVPYNLLNAKPENIEREAEIITQAGQKNTITISTNMAGRGTDIILGGNPKAMTQLMIINYIKKLCNVPNRYKENEEFNNQDIRNLIETINLNNEKILMITNNIEEYTNYIINNSQIDLLDKEEKNIYNIYIQILEKYNQAFIRDREEVIKLGGLYVIGTERHESRRIDNQLRGRSGRQGDKGTSRFFLSLQDNLFRIFGGDKIQQLMSNLNIADNIPIESIILSKSLDGAQKKVESYFYDVRKQLFEYDEVINNQRQAIYTERKRILQSSFIRDCIIEYAEYTIDEILLEYNNNTNKKEKIITILKLFNFTTPFDLLQLEKMNKQEIKKFLYEQFRVTYDLKENYLEQIRPGLMRQLEKYYLLQQIDQAWQTHIGKMSLLKEYIGWRSYGQQDPLIEYKNEAFHLFINMVTYIRQTVIYLSMRSRLIINIKE